MMLNFHHLPAVAFVSLAFLLNSTDNVASRDISIRNGDKFDYISKGKRENNKPYFFTLNSSSSTSSLTLTTDPGSNFDVQLSPIVPKDAQPDTRSLRVSLLSDYAENTKDKIMLDVLPHWGKDRIDITKTLARASIEFDIMFDKSYQVSRYWTIHLQAWQCCGGQPPVALSVAPKPDPRAPLVLQINVQSDLTHEGGNTKGQVIGEAEVERDAWINVKMELQPSTCDRGENGHVKVKIDGQIAADWKGCWGYALSANSAVTHTKITPAVGFDLGIYRRREALVQTVYFANIRYNSNQNGK